MSEANKTRFEVQAILGDNLMAALTQFGLTNWGVAEFANPSLQNMNGVVLMNYLKSNRFGWQGDSIDSLLIEHQEWMEIQSWQIHCIAKRTDSTTDSSILAEDVASDLIAWFNGHGCKYFRERGLSNLVIDANSILVYNDNSNLYQKRAVFTVKIVVPKEITSTVDELTQIQPNIMPV